MDESRKKYRKYNLPIAEDTTLHGEQVLLTPGFLRLVGELLFGERWQTPLAQWLGSARGKALAPATVHQWSTETRSIPDWVGDALAAALDHGQQDLERRAKAARGIAGRMRRAAPTAMTGERDRRDHAFREA